MSKRNKKDENNADRIVLIIELLHVIAAIIGLITKLIE